jgi:ribose 5-phosphate isomerase B
MIKIAIGCDHAGYELKKEIIETLVKWGYEIVDFGTNCKDYSVDYPDYGLAVAKAIKNGECEKGIIICGTGIGISISANKIPSIRAALCTNSYMAKMSREHNDANVLALGSRIVGFGLALDIVETWLKTDFLGGRHKIRVDKIDEIMKSENISF